MIKELDYDVIVLGAGGAGCAAAIAAAKNGVSVALLSKEAIGMGNTRISDAGITISGDLIEEDSAEILKEDIIKGGEYLNDKDLVEVIANNASSALRFVEEIGHYYLRDKEGRLSAKVSKKLGGHSFSRSFVSIGGSGRILSQALRNAVANTKSISVFENMLAITLFQEEQEVRGLLGLDLMTSDAWVIRSGAAILATGGCGCLFYPQTTNTVSATGDGYAIALEAGAKIIGMEMVQFMPFAMNHPPQIAGSNIDDTALAGPKGKLINGCGQVVADHDINQLTRAQVTALMAKEISAGRTTPWGGLLLDLSENLSIPQMIEYKKLHDERKRYEKIRKFYGEEAFHWRAPLDVSPSAHYMMGGVKIDTKAQTSLKRLYAAGEVAGGVMGANRLGTVSIADLFVMGRIAGKEAAQCAIEGSRKKINKLAIKREVNKVEKYFELKGSMPPIKLKRELQQLMLKNVGIVRDEGRLNIAINSIDSMLENLEKDLKISSMKRYNTDLIDFLELKNMLICGKLVAHCAKIRKESRGAHLRMDYPKRDDRDWLINIIMWKENGKLETIFTDINTKDIYNRIEGRPFNA